MPIAAGTKLSSYEVLSALGKGGMGEVWRARDSKLGREVAIKTLPEEFAKDEERLARFEREAKLLASLNHPNIAAIYGLEEQNGTRFLVLELVEGDTLAERLKRGAIPVEESLKLALQIAEALEAAHEKGVIHRDLKPANIKVTPDGKVKVLDFGLAKAFTGDGVDASVSNSPTLSMAATGQGVILGTAAYMSPEQARGESTDKRADIWAFGCVLYEMLTGRQTWGGRTVTDVIAGLVAREPDWGSLPPNLHPRLRLVIERCLEKESKDRGHDIADVRVDIRKVLSDPSGVIVQPVAEVVHRAPQSKLPWVAAAVATVAAIALGMGWWLSSQPEDLPLVRLDVDLGQDVSLGPINGRSVIITPDGTRIAYVASISGGPRRLYTRRLDQADPTELPRTDGANHPFFSPDGEWIGFAAEGTINKISVEGGAVVPLGDTESFVEGSWGEDGVIVFSHPLTGGLMTIPEDGGDITTLIPLDQGELAFFQPQILPGGQGVLFSTATQLTGGGDQSNVEVFSFAGRVRKILVPGATSPAYLPSGHLVYNSGGTLFATAFDLDALVTLGSRVPVLNDLGTDSTGATSIAFSREGAVVYRTGGGEGTANIARSTVEWLDSEGNREPLISTPGRYVNLRLSPDAEQVALIIWDGSGVRVSVYDPERDNMTRLTFDEGAYFSPVWSPDQRNVVFGSIGGGMLQARVDGAGPPQLLLEGDVITVPVSFAPDLRLAYFKSGEGGRDIRTVAVEDDGNRLTAGEPEPFLATPFDEAPSRFSPDGRWLVYHSNESGQHEVSVRAFPPPSSGEGDRFPISNGGGTNAVWSPNSPELFYFSLDGQIMAVDWRVEGDRFIADRPRVWAADPGGAFWDMAPDGRALLTVPVETDEAQEGPETDHHVVFLGNFFDYLRREVPVP